MKTGLGTRDWGLEKAAPARAIPMPLRSPLPVLPVLPVLLLPLPSPESRVPSPGFGAAA
jgi:hypothetical protein